MRRSLQWAALAISAALAPLGCSDAAGTRTSQTTEHTTTTTKTAPAPTAPAGRVDMDGTRTGAPATGQTATNGRDAVDVDVGPAGGVNVDVQGEPIRDRLRERRAARDGNLPR
jgi:hypothetical protein